MGAYTHPPMNSYNVKTFHFMNTHPPIKHIQSVTLSLYIYFGWFMGWVVDAGGVVGGFMGGWLCGGMGGWRVHGVGGGRLGGWRVHGVGLCVVVWVVVGYMVGWVVGGFMGWLHVLTHPEKVTMLKYLIL